MKTQTARRIAPAVALRFDSTARQKVQSGRSRERRVAPGASSVTSVMLVS